MKAFKIIGSIFLTLLLIAVGFVGGVVYETFNYDRIETEDFQEAWLEEGNTGNQGGGEEGNTGGINDGWVEDGVITSSELSIHFLELGNKYAGDCVYIKCGENDILIDAGSRQSSADTIIEYVDNFVTDNTLEYVIATHEDRDHISGFVGLASGEGVFDHYVVETIIDFPLQNKNSEIYQKYVSKRDAEIEAGAKHYSALDCYNNQNGGQRKYQLSDSVEMEILYNYYYENTTSDTNNYSVCMMLNQGENHYMFTGDLEKEGEEHLVSYYKENHGGLPHCVLYKGGHHGSKTSSTPDLMKAISPEIVCVCCCAGSDEYTDIVANQFPTQDFINNIAPFTEQVYITTMIDSTNEGGFTSMNGNIVVYYKDNKVNLRCSNNTTKLKDTEWFKNNRTCPTEWQN